METTGTIKSIAETRVVSEKFKKREFVLTVIDNQFEETILFQLSQDRCDILNNSHVGDKVKVHFNLRGRGWTRPADGQVLVFNSLDVWKVEAIEAAASTAAAQLPVDPGTGLPF